MTMITTSSPNAIDTKISADPATEASAAPECLRDGRVDAAALTTTTIRLASLAEFCEEGDLCQFIVRSEKLKRAPNASRRSIQPL
jgi:hypothetical protein